jgi:hypothetical protein
MGQGVKPGEAVRAWHTVPCAGTRYVIGARRLALHCKHSRAERLHGVKESIPRLGMVYLHTKGAGKKGK